MPKGEKSKSYTAMTVVDVAELLGVTDRGIRKWIKEKGLPARSDPRGFTLDWPSVLQWYVEQKVSESCGTGGTASPKTATEERLETMEAALARRTRAEADLKELQLATARGQVAAIEDVRRVLTASNKSIQTLLLALPSSLATRLLGLDDRSKIYHILDTSMRSVLSNAAGIDAILEARKVQPEDEPE